MRVGYCSVQPLQPHSRIRGRSRSESKPPAMVSTSAPFPLLFYDLDHQSDRQFGGYSIAGGSRPDYITSLFLWLSTAARFSWKSIIQKGFAQIWNQLTYSSTGERIKKMCSIYTMEYYLDIKKDIYSKM